jgi:hypothetical protein
MKQGFHVLARAADEIELPQSGLGMSVAALQSRREFLRPVVQSVIEATKIIAMQKERTVPVLMRQLSINQEEAGFIYDAIYKGWAVNGKPTAERGRGEGFHLAPVVSDKIHGLLRVAPRQLSIAWFELGQPNLRRGLLEYY